MAHNNVRREWNHTSSAALIAVRPLPLASDFLSKPCLITASDVPFVSAFFEQHELDFFVAFWPDEETSFGLLDGLSFFLSGCFFATGGSLSHPQQHFLVS